eukprot:TRINITY_DN55644_c0_g1_i1.p1 TRINITY_DN55644_c0_g1~~TRINITY_DN55644_c0_g1_i1.p1  ORF type:complete len:503 (+),score=129.36 TRINITY_DN55644_c0_g1_i1:57-1511(+)
MADNEKELAWISDCLFAVFRAPTWVAPIAKFIDENCSTFEDLEENKLEYTPIFNAFKQLVDDLLSAHLLELSVTQEQFERFCAHGLNDGHELHRSVVEQLLSVDDFLVFKAMMVKRSAELNLQVLQPNMHPEDGTQAGVVSAGEESIGGLVSAEAPLDDEEEAERVEAQRRIVEAEMQLAVALSLQLEQRLRLVQALEERLRLIERLTEVLEATAEVQRQQDEALAQQLAEAAAAAPEHQEALTSHQQQLQVAKEEQQATYQVQQQELSKQLVAETGIPKTVRLEPLQGAAQHTLPVGVETPGVAKPAPLSEVDRWELEKKRSEATLRRARAPAPASAPRVSVPTPEPVQPGVAPQPLPSAAPPPNVPTEDEKRARAEHLKKQRELLIEKRNRERATSLAAHQQSMGSTLASRAAERACAQVPRGLSDADDGRRLAAELSGQPPPVSQEEAEAAAVAQTEAAAAAMRRTITQQLKQSLVGSLRG